MYILVMQVNFNVLMYELIAIKRNQLIQHSSYKNTLIAWHKNKRS